ncbi:lebocin-4-like [Trichoplusia ni]|uniref:Lebocin-4-like n=1 Tax=Trichoplusia ni TaxID=7111 RepID=A0A7E5W193_TRINI|nr:lebocin-4-like [Trichoplusia ni]
MSKYILVLCVLSAFLIAEATCQRIILPTYRPPPPPRRPVIMRARRELEVQPSVHGEETYPGFEEVSEVEHHGERVERSIVIPCRSRDCIRSRPPFSHRNPPLTHPSFKGRIPRSLPSLKLPGRGFRFPTTKRPFIPKPGFIWNPKPGRYPISA